MQKYLFIIILIIVLGFSLVFHLIEESFDTNLFFKPLPDIFLSSNYLNYELNKANIKPSVPS